MLKSANIIPGVLALVLSVGAGNLPANAGDCPAGQERADATDGQNHSEGKGVTDTVLAMNDLGAHHPELAGRVQRIRMLVVEPGGEVPWHSHADRPAMIYITEGAVTEYRSTCAVPIEHKAGGVAAEIGGLQHWWKNNTDVPARLISVDLPRSE